METKPRCSRCRRALRTPASITNGMGPTCWRKSRLTASTETATLSSENADTGRKEVVPI